MGMNKTAATASTTELEQQRMQRFLHWLQAHGAVFPGIDIRTSEGGRGAYASHSLLDGDMVLFVPHTLWLSADKVKESEIGTWFQHALPALRESCFLAIYLLWTIRNDGFFKPYTDVLPRDVSDMPTNFSEADLAWLEGTSALPLIRAEIEHIDAEYRQLSKHFPPGFSFTLDEYKWAKSVVNSRTFHLPPEDGGGAMMVPLADMMDHDAPHNNVNWGGKPGAGFLCMVNKDVPHHAQLTLSYGRKGNAMLFYAYGFTLQDNRNDDTDLFFPGLGNGSGTAGVTFSPIARYNHVNTRKMFAHLRGLHGQGSHFMLRAAASRENELAVLDTLRRVCRERIAGFPPLPRPDMEPASLSGRVQNALRVREGELQVLNYLLALAEAGTAFLNGGEASGFDDYLKELAPLLQADAVAA